MRFVKTTKNITDVIKHPVMLVAFITWLKIPSNSSSLQLSKPQKKNLLSIESGETPDFSILKPRQVVTEENLGKLGRTIADTDNAA